MSVYLSVSVQMNVYVCAVLFSIPCICENESVRVLRSTPCESAVAVNACACIGVSVSAVSAQVCASVLLDSCEISPLSWHLPLLICFSTAFANSSHGIPPADPELLGPESGEQASVRRCALRAG
jgi:hypothetical protein